MDRRTALDEYDADRPQTGAATLARNTEWSRRQLLRLAKGRPATRTTYQQYDRSRNALVTTATPDPILDLYAARRLRRSSALHAQRYDALRQTVAAPAVLP